MRRNRASPTALRSGSFLPEEATEVDAPAAGIVVVVGTVVVVVVVVVVGTVVVVVVVVVVGKVVEMSESGASLLHVAAVANIETTPRQTATLMDR